MNFDELIKQLKVLEFTDLVNLYLEAKLGEYTTAEDLLSVETVQLIYELEEAIKEATDE